MRPLIFCFRHQDLDSGSISASALQLASWPQYTWHIMREETGWTFLLLTLVVPFLSEQDMDTARGGNAKKPSPLTGNCPLSLYVRLEREQLISATVSLWTATFLCPCFTFRNTSVGNSAIIWRYIVCEDHCCYHWESSNEIQHIHVYV